MNCFIKSLMVILMASAATINLNAQDKAIHPGAKGIYIDLGKTIPKNIKYVVARKAKGDKNWKAIATVSSPADYVQFDKNLHAFWHCFSPKQPLQPSQSKEIWEKIQKTDKPELGKPYSAIPYIKLAMGTMYLDSLVSKENQYMYRVATTDAQGREIQSFETQPVPFPSIPAFAKAQYLNSKVEGRWIKLYFQLGKGERPGGYLTSKSYGKDKGFFSVNMDQHITEKGETTIVELKDTINNKVRYAYYSITPTDVYGNQAPSDETIAVSMFSAVTFPAPEKIRAQLLKEQGSVRLSWKINETQYIKSISVYRSIYYDSAYKCVSTLPGFDTVFVDSRVRPMQKYYYYFVTNGHLGEQSTPTIRVFAIPEDSKKPGSPARLKATGAKNGVKLSWEPDMYNIKGYYVYRADGYKMPMQQLSGLIPVSDSVTTFIDTSKVLSGMKHYAYCVQAENTSHVRGFFSDTVLVRPGKLTVPETPFGLRYLKEGKGVRIYWHDMNQLQDGLQGYYIYRREGEKGEFTCLNPKKLIMERVNNYYDTLLMAGKVYDYKINSIDIYGGVSKFSEETRVMLSLVKPIAPKTLQYFLTDKGVMLEWSPVYADYVKEYRIYRHDNNAKPKLVATVNKDTDSWEDTNCPKDKMQIYFITLCDKNGKESEKGVSVAVTR